MGVGLDLFNRIGFLERVRTTAPPRETFACAILLALLRILIGCSGSAAPTPPPVTTRSGSSTSAPTASSSTSRTFTPTGSSSASGANTPSATTTATSETSRADDWTTYHRDNQRSGYIPNLNDPHQLSVTWNTPSPKSVDPRRGFALCHTHVGGESNMRRDAKGSCRGDRAVIAQSFDTAHDCAQDGSQWHSLRRAWMKK